MTADPLVGAQQPPLVWTLGAATAGDLAPFNDLLAVVRDPFNHHPGRERYEQPAPADAAPFITYS